MVCCVDDTANSNPGDTCAIAGGWLNSVKSGRDVATVLGGKECYAKVRTEPYVFGVIIFLNLNSTETSI